MTLSDKYFRCIQCRQNLGYDLQYNKTIIKSFYTICMKCHNKNLKKLNNIKNILIDSKEVKE